MQAAEQVAPIGLLTNPESYRNRNGRGESARELAAEHPAIRVFDVVDRTAIEAAVNELAALRPGLIMVDGGDGTVQGVVTQLRKQWPGNELPWIGVVPGGRTNVISRDVNGKCDRRRAFLRIVQRYLAGARQARVSRRTLMVEWQDRGPEYGFLVSAGGLATSIEDCWTVQRRLNRLGRFGGLGTSMWIAWKLLSTMPGQPLMPPRRGHIEVDGDRLPGSRFQTVLVSTHERFPLGICPFWGQGDGRLRVTAVAARARGLWWRWVPLILCRGRLLPQDGGYCSCNGGSLEMELDQSFHLDGERWPLDGPTRLRIHTGPSVAFVSGARQTRSLNEPEGAGVYK